MEGMMRVIKNTAVGSFGGVVYIPTPFLPIFASY
jgi:hypothetical protein